MKKSIVALLLCAFVLSGCNGPNTRDTVLKPAIQDAWDSLRNDAVDPAPMDEAVIHFRCPELVIVWAQTVLVPTGDASVLRSKAESIKQLTNAINIYCGVIQ